MRIDGSTACVTGAGGGIGRAVALELVSRGCERLVLVDVDGESLADTSGRLAGEAEVLRAQVDVSNRAQMEQLVERTRDRFGMIQLLVNNAGVTSLSSFREQSLDDFERILDINLRGVVLGCKLFLPLLEDASEGHIVNMSSMAGYAGMPHQSAYCASKFAVRGFSESLRIELAHRRIGVTSVHPGVVNTQIISSANAVDLATRDKLASLLARHVVTPRRVARRIANAIEQNTPELRVCVESYLLDWTRRLHPGLVRGVMQLVYRRFAVDHD